MMLMVPSNGNEGLIAVAFAIDDAPASFKEQEKECGRDHRIRLSLLS